MTPSSSLATLRFLASAALLLLAWLAPNVVSSGPNQSDSHRPLLALRPGFAAAPFGWTTVVADFDADRVPDLAIADRTAGSRFQIDVRLSEGPTQSVSFVSTESVLNITALDIDNDRDADLVVTQVLSRRVIGIWLNDGTGHFDRHDTSAFPPVAPKIDTANLDGLSHQVQASVMPKRRIVSGIASVSTAAPLTSCAAAPDRFLDVACTPVPSAASPRAPPFARC
jgi:hypothetical protein